MKSNIITKITIVLSSILFVSTANAGYEYDYFEEISSSSNVTRTADFYCYMYENTVMTLTAECDVNVMPQNPNYLANSWIYFYDAESYDGVRVENVDGTKRIIIEEEGDYYVQIEARGQKDGSLPDVSSYASVEFDGWIYIYE